MKAFSSSSFHLLLSRKLFKCFCSFLLSFMIQPENFPPHFHSNLILFRRSAIRREAPSQRWNNFEIPNDLNFQLKFSINLFSHSFYVIRQICFLTQSTSFAYEGNLWRLLLHSRKQPKTMNVTSRVNTYNESVALIPWLLENNFCLCARANKF